MSDFLTHLAVRALAAPSLRPRTRFRYEPASPETPALAERGIESTARGATSHVAPIPNPTAQSLEPPADRPAVHTILSPIAATAADPVSPARVAEVAPSITPSAREVAPRDTTAAPRDVTEVVRRTEVATERVVERILMPATESPHATGSRHETPAPIALPPATRHRYDDAPARIVREEVTRRDATAPHHSPSPRPADDDHRDETAQRVMRETTHREERVVRTEVERVPALPIERIRESASRDAATRVAHNATSRQSPVAQTSSEPIIQVSIGRVEVRAVAAPQASQRVPRRGPMTLDEYSARRGGGERR